VSYAFAPASWGNGYATELVQYAVQHALVSLAVPEVNAFAMPENTASIRVLQNPASRWCAMSLSLNAIIT